MPDDRPIERLVGETRALEKSAPQKQRELLVAVLGEAGPKAFFHGNSPNAKADMSPPLLNRRRRSVNENKGVARPMGDEIGGPTNGAGKGASRADRRVRR